MGAVSAAAGLTALVLAGLLMWKKKLPKVSVLLLLVGASGLAGWVGSWLRTAAGYVEGFVDQITRIGVGASVGGLIVLVLVFIVVHDLWPKQKANRTTQMAAFALPLFGIAGGGIVATAIGAIVTAVGNALVSLVSFV